MTDFFSDLDTDLNAAPETAAPANIREAAHIANGGEATFDCPKCHGTGTFRGYARTFRCFKCNGGGKVSKGVAAAAKGRATQEANRAAFIDENAALISALREIAPWHQFAGSLVAQIDEGKRLSDRQIEAAHSALARVAERREQKRAEQNAERDAKSGAVDISGIAKLFETATDNDIKRPIFRADGIQISKAPAHGANAGALYVKSNEGDYLGKIVDGSRFMASREAPADTLGRLQAVAADPTAEAIKYARRTGRCSCCGKGLVDPVSIRAGIGPICAERWGLDYRREFAADELAAEAAQEAAR